MGAVVGAILPPPNTKGFEESTVKDGSGADDTFGAAVVFPNINVFEGVACDSLFVIPAPNAFIDEEFIAEFDPKSVAPTEPANADLVLAGSVTLVSTCLLSKPLPNEKVDDDWPNVNDFEGKVVDELISVIEVDPKTKGFESDCTDTAFDSLGTDDDGFSSSFFSTVGAEKPKP